MWTMYEKDILLKTIEGLNASIASLSATNRDQAEQIKNLQERIKELTTQIAWLNRQLFGRKTEKLPVYNPDMPDLFAEEFAGLQHQAEEKRDEAVEQIEKEPVKVRKQKRQNRKMTEGLPVLEPEVIEPAGVALSLYRRIGEEVTQVVKHQTGGALCQGNHPSHICAQGQHPASSRRAERSGDCPHAADAHRQVHRRHQPACRDTASEV